MADEHQRHLALHRENRHLAHRLLDGAALVLGPCGEEPKVVDDGQLDPAPPHCVPHRLQHLLRAEFPVVVEHVDGQLPQLRHRRAPLVLAGVAEVAPKLGAQQLLHGADGALLKAGQHHGHTTQRLLAGHPRRPRGLPGCGVARHHHQPRTPAAQRLVQLGAASGQPAQLAGPLHQLLDGVCVGVHSHQLHVHHRRCSVQRRVHRALCHARGQAVSGILVRQRHSAAPLPT